MNVDELREVIALENLASAVHDCRIRDKFLRKPSMVSVRIPVLLYAYFRWHR